MKLWPRRDFIRAAGASAAAALAPSILKARRQEASRPNIVLIMADDMGFSDLGCYGSEIPTPNIDSLAARGTRFRQFYNCAVCCPTRSSLLSGVFPHQAGLGWWARDSVNVPRPPGAYQGFLSSNCVTVAEVLKSAGYRTLMSGKWHVGADRPHWPVDRGFDRYFGLLIGGANYFEPVPQGHSAGESKPPPGGARKPAGLVHMALDDKPYIPPREGFYLTDAFTDHAVGFLGQEGREKDPFFLYLAYTAPHCPLHAPPEDIARHRGRYRAGWDVVRARRYEKMKALGVIGANAPLSPRDPGVHPWADEKEPELMDLKMAIYAAQVERLDRGVGRVLAKLREIGKEDNTLIFFLSDNGACAVPKVSNIPEKFNRPPYLGGPKSYEIYGRAWANVSDTPLRRFKYWMEEGGISTPMIAAGPGISHSGGFSPGYGHVMDFMPTFLEVSGAKYPENYRGNSILPLEGSSLVPLLRGKNRPRPGTLCWEFEGSRAIRQGPWKLVGEKEGFWELFNLDQDRTELRDLSRQEPERVKAMVADYQRWEKRCGVRSWKELSPLFGSYPWGRAVDF